MQQEGPHLGQPQALFQMPMELTPSETILFKLLIKILPDVRNHINSSVALNSKGALLFAVGGWVRDSILGVHSDDLDFIVPSKTSTVISKNLQNMLSEYSAAEGHRIVCEERVNFLQNEKVKGLELKILKISILYRDTGKPVHSWDIDIRELPEGLKIDQDYKSRDFTINCIYLDVEKGELYDPIGVEWGVMIGI